MRESIEELEEDFKLEFKSVSPTKEKVEQFDKMMQRYLRLLWDKVPLKTSSAFKQNCEAYKAKLKRSLPHIVSAISNRDLNNLVVEFTQ